MYAVTPHGHAFGADALFSIPLSAATLPAGVTPLLLKAEPGGTWRVMNNAGADAARLAADVGGLSYFVIGGCTESDAAWVIGFDGCPSNHELRLTMLDGQNQPANILRGPNGVQLPLWYVTDTVQTRTFILSWTRPAGTSRTDTVGLYGSFGSGVTVSLNPRVEDVNVNGMTTPGRCSDRTRAEELRHPMHRRRRAHLRPVTPQVAPARDPLPASPVVDRM